MPTPFDRRVNDNPSTYFVQDRKNQKELARLAAQDQMATIGMGGILPEQADPTVFHRVLDIGCGTGGWIIESAQVCPTMSLIGIDISERMIKYARTQAETRQLLHNRVEFHVMDALQTLKFPDAYFDLVNLRFGSSFLRTWDWPKFLTELLRVTSPGGVIRVTEGENSPQSDSPALARLHGMLRCALYRAGHLFTEESTGVIDHLAHLLDQYGCEQVQTKVYSMEYPAGTPEGQAFYEDVMLIFQTTRPFIQKRGCASQDYEAIYQQARDEMQQPGFRITWNVFTTWGSKPRPRSPQF